MIGYLESIAQRQRGEISGTIAPRPASLYDVRHPIAEPEPAPGADPQDAVVATVEARPWRRAIRDDGPVAAVAERAAAAPLAPEGRSRMPSAPLEPSPPLAPRAPVLAEITAGETRAPSELARRPRLMAEPQAPRQEPSTPSPRPAPLRPTYKANSAAIQAPRIAAIAQDPPPPPEAPARQKRDETLVRHEPLRSAASPIVPRIEHAIAPPPRLAASAAPAGPEVVVTIGRIEVRAVPAPAAPPRAASRGATMSLEDYLRQRAQGVR